MHIDFDTRVKLTIYGTVAETGVLPSAAEVAQKTGSTPTEVVAAFARLHAKRLLVSEPGDPSRIRMAPPFSGVVTPFPVEARGRRYYANCVWDALGVAAVLHEDAVIPAADGFTGESLTLEVKNDRPVPRNCVIHFAVPAARWWEDIIHTCATMLLFRSEETVNRWCQTHGVPPRPLVTLDQLWQLAVVWYANRLTVESRRPAADEMVGIFAAIGLEGPFWNPKADAWESAT